MMYIAWHMYPRGMSIGVCSEMCRKAVTWLAGNAWGYVNMVFVIPIRYIECTALKHNSVKTIP